MQVFQYESLDLDSNRRPIRLLELLPGSDTIECKLRHAFLDDEPQYEAISYCWGSPNTCKEILCNTSKLSITESLHSAFTRFRRTEEPRTLWVDQLCINQADREELGFQVSFMREIYENALQTLIWLGDVDTEQKNDNPDEAFKLLKRLAVALGKRRSLTPPDTRTMFELSPAELASLGLPEVVSDKIWQSVRLIWSRPWFHRLWVIQEVTVSKHVVVDCSQSSIDWSDLVAAATCAFELGSFYIVGNYSSFGTSVETLRLRRQVGTDVDLASLLIEFWHYQASDPRDKVFALIGLAAHTYRDAIAPDYTLAAATVYLTTTLAILDQSRNLDMLCAVNKCADAEVESSSPSWVLDYTDSPTPKALCLMPWHNISNRPRTERGPRFRAARLSEAQPGFSETGQELSVSGFVLDTVEVTAMARLAPPSESHSRRFITKTGAVQDGANLLKVLAAWEAFAGARGPKYVNGEDIEDVLWQIVVGGCSGEEYEQVRTEYRRLRRDNTGYGRLSTSWFARFEFSFLVLLGFIVSGVVVRALMKKQFVVEMAFLDRMVVITGRRMVRTATGLLALAPAACRVGDKIALVRGASMPLVLRALGSRWKLIGGAYVHSIMYGEAFEDDRCQTIRLI